MAAVLVAGCSGGGTADTAAPTSSSTPSTSSVSATPSPSGTPAALKIGLPNYPDAVTDATGRAVYTFSGDKNGNVTCLDSCAEEWPPVLTDGEPTIVGGDPVQVGTQGLGQGKKPQATYGGWPLYYFSGDKAPGAANGLGQNAFGGQWFLILKNTNRIGR